MRAKQESDTPQALSTETPSQRRWRKTETAERSSLKRNVALSSCVFALLVGMAIGFVSLPSRRSNVVLVSLFIPPPDSEAIGTDAPHFPATDAIFGLKVVNLKATPKPTPSTDSVTTHPAVDSQADAAAPKFESSVSNDEVTDWREATAKCSPEDQLVLHVSSFARVDRDQVFFYGRDLSASSDNLLSLRDVLSTVANCDARRKLIVLEVHWPIVSDAGDSATRLKQLNKTICQEVQSEGDESCQVMLSSIGDGPARGLATQPRSLMSHYLTLALQSNEADINHDGRVSLQETIDWASPRISSASRRSGNSQTIGLLEAARTFDFTIAPNTPIEKVRRYPVALRESWERRSQYVSATTLPFLAEVAKRWGTGLSALESRWRRGEPIASIEKEVNAVEAKCLEAVNASLVKRRGIRADSLQIAAERFPQSSSVHANQLAADLIKQHREIIQSTPVENQAAVLVKAIATYTASFQDGDEVVGLASLLNVVAKSPTLDPHLLDLITQVHKTAIASNDFPVIEAIKQVANSELEANPMGRLLQIYQLQDRLGSLPDGTGFLELRSTRASELLASAQRLVLERGMASTHRVDQYVESTLAKVESTLLLEQAINLAIRRVRFIADTISADRCMGMVTTTDDVYLELMRAMEKTVGALEAIKLAANAIDGVPSAELALLHQATEALDRSWTSWTDRRLSDFLSSPMESGQPLSIAIPASVRSEVFSRLADEMSDTDLLTARSTPTMKTLAISQLPNSSQDRCLKCLDRLASITSDVDARYQRWWTSFISETSKIEAIPVYQLIAARHSIAERSDPIPVVTLGDLAELNWDRPNASLGLRYESNNDNTPVTFEFLKPVSPNLQVLPSRGVLRSSEVRDIHFQLSTANVNPSVGTFSGIWLRLSRGTEQRLLPIRIPNQPSQPSIEIDFGPFAKQAGRDVALQLWPDTKAQPIDWKIKSNDSSIKSVVVTVRSSNGTSLTSAPLLVTNDVLTSVRFPAVKPSPPDVIPIPGLSGDLTVLVTDPSLGTSLGRWTVTTELRDPRMVVEPISAEFKVESTGKNRLEVKLRSKSSMQPISVSHPFTPTLRFELDSIAAPRLIDFGDSRLQSLLKPDGKHTMLYAENLRFEEGTPPVITIPLSINGDKGYYELVGRFPRREGSIELRWNLQSQLRIEASQAIVPGTPLAATILARNLDDTQSIRVEVLGGEQSSEEILWQTILPLSRQANCIFESGEGVSTFNVVATRSDWQLGIPTNFGTGPHRLRVSTTSAAGSQDVVAEHLFLIDAGVPEDVIARADIEQELTTIHIAARSSLSGIASVSIEPSSMVADKTFVPLTGARQTDNGSRWKIVWPKGIAIPDRLLITFTTNAGKTIATNTPLTVQIIKPIGKVVGRVVEGSIPQPNLTVSLNSIDGSAVARVRTGDDGSYSFAVPPGNYLLNVEKSATNRRATIRVTSEDRVTTSSELVLLRSI